MARKRQYIKMDSEKLTINIKYIIDSYMHGKSFKTYEEYHAWCKELASKIINPE